MKGRCRVACVASIGIALVWATASLGGSGPGGSTVTELVGRSLTAFPHFEYARAFPEGTTLEYAIDPTRFSSVQGATCTVYVVSSLTVAQWEALIAEESSYLPSLEVRSTGSHTTCFPTQPPLDDIQDYRCPLAGSDTLSSQAEPCFVVNGEDVCIGLGHPNALVLDCDQDGELGPGDFIDGATDEAGFYVVHDTGASRLETGCLDYDADGLPEGLSENFAQQRTHFPSNWDEVASCETPGGPCATPLPLVVISHGVGHFHDRYNYLQEHLASYGYIVMSHKNKHSQTSPALDPATATLEHTDVLLDILGDVNCEFRLEDAAACNGSTTTASDLCEIAPAIDSSRLVWIGHSRGGQGVVHAYNLIEGDPPQQTPEHFDEDDIALISTMAPLDRPLNATPGMKPFHLFWSAADADISGTPTFSGGDQLPFQMLDRARGHKQSVYIHGGAHGWFHEACGPPSDDESDCWPFQPDVNSPTQENIHSLVERYYVPLLAKYLGGNIPAQDYLWRWASFEQLPATIVQEHKLGVDPLRFVLDDYELNYEDPQISSTGLSVSYSPNLTPVEEEMQDTDCHFDWMDPDTPPTPAAPLPECETGLRCIGSGSGTDDCTACLNGAAPNSSSLVRCDFHNACPDFDAEQAMNGLTRSRPGSESRGAIIEWSPNDSVFYEWSVPPQPWNREDLFLSFRIAQTPRHTKTLDLNGELDFTVTVEDADTDTASVRLGAYGAGITKPFPRRGPGLETWNMPTVATLIDCFCRQPDNGVCSVSQTSCKSNADCPPGESCPGLQLCCRTLPGAGDVCNPNLSEEGWQAEFETIRIRLTDFLNNSGPNEVVDLDNLARIRFEFGSIYGSDRGRIVIDDVEITSDTVILDPPCPSVTPCNGQGCLQDAEISSTDSGLNTCLPASGPVLDCGTQTAHVVTYSCEKAACCFEDPACVCPAGNCTDGTYLECR